MQEGVEEEIEIKRGRKKWEGKGRKVMKGSEEWVEVRGM
jgi:hypothetical protein